MASSSLAKMTLEKVEKQQKNPTQLTNILNFQHKEEGIRIIILCI